MYTLDYTRKYIDLPNEDNFEETGPVGWKGFKRQFIAKLDHKSETSP